MHIYGTKKIGKKAKGTKTQSIYESIYICDDFLTNFVMISATYWNWKVLYDTLDFHKMDLTSSKFNQKLLIHIKMG